MGVKAIDAHQAKASASQRHRSLVVIGHVNYGFSHEASHGSITAGHGGGFQGTRRATTLVHCPTGVGRAGRLR